MTVDLDAGRSGRRWVALGVLAIGCVTMTLCWFVMPATFAGVGERLAVGVPELALLVSAFVIGYGVMHIPAGFLAARFGLRTVLAVGLGLEGLLTAAQPPYLGQGGGCAMMAAFGLAHTVTHGAGDLGARLRRWEAVERPLIEHTQRFAHWVGRLNDVPDLPRTVLLAALGRSAAFGRSRLRAPDAVPTGIASRLTPPGW